MIPVDGPRSKSLVNSVRFLAGLTPTQRRAAASDHEDGLKGYRSGRASNGVA